MHIQLQNGVLNDNLISQMLVSVTISIELMLKNSIANRGGKNVAMMKILADIIIEELATQFLTNPVFDYHNFSASLGGQYEFNDY